MHPTRAPASVQSTERDITMKRYAVGVVAVLVVGAIGSGTAFSATSKPWQATVGHFKTTTKASAEMTKLTGKGLSGFTTETDKSSGAKFEVMRGFATQKQAKTEVSKLHKSGFKGAAVESEKSEKTTG